MIIYCCCCGKQAVSGNPSIFDKYTTKLEGGRANFGNTVFCGYCAEDLDEYGLFPEERCMLTKEERWIMYGGD